MEGSILYVIGEKGTGLDLLRSRMNVIELSAEAMPNLSDMLSILEGVGGIRMLAVASKEYKAQVHSAIEYFAARRNLNVVVMNTDTEPKQD